MMLTSVQPVYVTRERHFVNVLTGLVCSEHSNYLPLCAVCASLPDVNIGYMLHQALCVPLVVK